MPPTFSTAPTLLTPRLELRAHAAEDSEHVRSLWTDPDVLRYISPKPPTQQEVWARVLRYGGLWALLGFGYWAAFERESGRFVGEFGLAQFRREVMRSLPDYDALPEAGWVMRPWAQGQGFAGEAMTAVMAWRDEHLPANGTFCLIDPENAASLKLAAKLGFVPETELEDGTTVLRR